jgi:hypothetical protein
MRLESARPNRSMTGKALKYMERFYSAIDVTDKALPGKFVTELEKDSAE